MSFILKYIRRGATDLRGLASHAMALNQDLADASDIERLFHLFVWQINSTHASHGAALDTYEVWMTAPVVRWIAYLKPPYMVP